MPLHHLHFDPPRVLSPLTFSLPFVSIQLLCFLFLTFNRIFLSFFLPFSHSLVTCSFLFIIVTLFPTLLTEFPSSIIALFHTLVKIVHYPSLVPVLILSPLRCYLFLHGLPTSCTSSRRDCCQGNRTEGTAGHPKVWLPVRLKHTLFWGCCCGLLWWKRGSHH